VQACWLKTTNFLLFSQHKCYVCGYVWLKYNLASRFNRHILNLLLIANGIHNSLALLHFDSWGDNSA